MEFNSDLDKVDKMRLSYHDADGQITMYQIGERNKIDDFVLRVTCTKCDGICSANCVITDEITFDLAFEWCSREVKLEHRVKLQEAEIRLLRNEMNLKLDKLIAASEIE